MLVMDDAGERERLGPRLERCGELWRPGIHPLCSCFFERLQPVLVPPEAVAELPFRSGHHWLEHKWWDHPQWGHFVEAVAHMHAVAQDQQRAETAYGFPPFDGVVLLADQARHQVSWQAAQAMLDVGVAALRSAVPRDGSSSPMCPADALPDGLSESERQIRLRSGLRVYFKEDLDATGGVCFEEASLARPNVVPWREGTQADAFRRDVWRLVGVQPGFHQPLQTHPPLMQALIAPPQQQQQPQPKREGASADTSCRPPRVLFLYRQPTHDWERPRHVLNLAQILDALRRAGVVAPVELATVNERMTAKEQLGLFADFGLLLSAHSSQLVNMVATPSGAAIIELAPAFSDADFGLQAEKLGIFYRIALGTGELPDGYQPERPEEDNCAKGGGYTGVRVPFSRCEPPLTEMNATHFRGLLEQCQDGLWRCDGEPRCMSEARSLEQLQRCRPFIEANFAANASSVERLVRQAVAYLHAGCGGWWPGALNPEGQLPAGSSAAPVSVPPPPKPAYKLLAAPALTAPSGSLDAVLVIMSQPQHRERRLLARETWMRMASDEFASPAFTHIWRPQGDPTAAAPRLRALFAVVVPEGTEPDTLLSEANRYKDMLVLSLPASQPAAPTGSGVELLPASRAALFRAVLHWAYGDGSSVASSARLVIAAEDSQLVVLPAVLQQADSVPQSEACYAKLTDEGDPAFLVSRRLALTLAGIAGAETKPIVYDFTSLSKQKLVYTGLSPVDMWLTFGRLVEFATFRHDGKPTPWGMPGEPTPATIIPCTEEQLATARQAMAEATAKELERAYDLYETLVLVKLALDSLSIPFYLMAGTLLGWARGCMIIPHTTDVDVAIGDETKLPLIRETMLRMGFKHAYNLGSPGFGREEAFARKTAKVDIYTAYPTTLKRPRPGNATQQEELDVVWTGVWRGGGTVYLKKLFWPLPPLLPSADPTADPKLQPRDWRWGMVRPFSQDGKEPALPPLLFRVGGNWEDWLINAYGKDWRKPVKNYSWWRSHKHVLECVEVGRNYRRPCPPSEM